LGLVFSFVGLYSQAMKALACIALLITSCGDFDQPDTSGWPPPSDFCGYDFHHCGWDGIRFCKGIEDSVSKKTCAAAQSRQCKQTKEICLEDLKKTSSESMGKTS